MTSFALIIGVTPLMADTGARAEVREALGTVVFFGNRPRARLTKIAESDGPARVTSDGATVGVPRAGTQRVLEVRSILQIACYTSLKSG
jgi:hypothetical protein